MCYFSYVVLTEFFNLLSQIVENTFSFLLSTVLKEFAGWEGRLVKGVGEERGIYCFSGLIIHFQ